MPLESHPASKPLPRRSRTAQPALVAPARRGYLRLGFLLSVCVHAVVLAWRGHVAFAPPPATSTLDVVLVNAQTLNTPLHPTVIAQHALDGGGEAMRGLAASPLPRTAAAPDEQVLLALQKRQTDLARQQAALLTQLDDAHMRLAVSQERAHDNPADGDDAAQANHVLASRIATLKARIEHDNTQPRRQFDAPAAARSAYAAYVEAWRLRIEQLGTQHYPPEARGRIYGSLQLTAWIRRDGSLERVTIDHPSEHAILNLAAHRIVQLAAPFAALPDDIARDVDVLAITRTWHFTDQHLDTAP